MSSGIHILSLCNRCEHQHNRESESSTVNYTCYHSMSDYLLQTIITLVKKYQLLTVKSSFIYLNLRNYLYKSPFLVESMSVSITVKSLMLCII